MKCPKCLTKLSSMRVLEGSLVAFTCEKCDRTLKPEEVLWPVESKSKAAAR